MKVSEELMRIFEEIFEERKSLTEWAEIESDDMFQTKNYCGGFDATENEFCFSYFNENSEEFWFQINLDEIEEVLKGNTKEIQIRPSE